MCLQTADTSAIRENSENVDKELQNILATMSPSASLSSGDEQQTISDDWKTSLHRPSPFTTPAITRPVSLMEGYSSANDSIVLASNLIKGRAFHSRRVQRRTRDNPRDNSPRDHKERWLWINPVIGLVMGIAITGALVYLGLQDTIGQQKYCPVLDEQFRTNTLDPKIWTMEVEVGGFGNQEFEETTTSPDNIYIKDGQLHIRPTLQNEKLIQHHSVINLKADGTCTGDSWSSCVAVTNVHNGTIVPPTKSARVNTKKGASIKYGRVEVTAKISQGDWLWPAIWMLPVDNVYGPWPESGEIDIMESRGNNYTYSPGGNNIASSSLHYGPDADNDAYLSTTNYKAALHSEYGDGFHIYGLEWTDSYVYTYIDSRLNQVLYIPFNEYFWTRGQFPDANSNGSLLINPWSTTGRKATPFDQSFYLILDVAVGGQNGWFPDGEGGKPWADGTTTAAKDFWEAKKQWFPSWSESSEMIVDRVQMWEQC